MASPIDEILENLWRIYDLYDSTKRAVERLNDHVSKQALRIEELERENAQLQEDFRDEREELLSAMRGLVGEPQ